jgi:hypothetical protein
MKPGYDRTTIMKNSALLRRFAPLTFILSPHRGEGRVRGGGSVCQLRTTYFTGPDKAGPSISRFIDRP